ncbi:pyridoxal-phosphate dependent enzyme [Fusibacter sp. JL216-2]|uniref:pyridoxal-phosphate dependent enzyme n=1 Tax=Fusibacter sp. JL216-2 TaxID=3071453 RepID=UPI003D34154A
MQKSGRTPLLRARKLEKVFDIGEIYIKLEGANPTGHKHDRIAETIVKDAIARGLKTIVVNGSYSYIRSIKYFAELEQIRIIVPVFKKEAWKSRRFDASEIVKFKNIQDDAMMTVLKEYAFDQKAYLAVEGHSSTHLSQMSMESLTEEIFKKAKFNIDTIFTKLSYGYTLTSTYSTMLRYWIDGRIDKYPKVICGTWAGANSIYEYYKKTNEVQDESVEEREENEQPANRIQIDKQLLEESLQAVFETKGEIHPVDEALLKESAKLLRKYEHIKVTPDEAYPFAAFYQMANSGKLTHGRHVIVLNDAKSIVKVDNLNDFDDVSKEKLIELTREWLAQYSDSLLETEDAIHNAMESGYILLASRNDQYEGICVLVHTGFENFIPTYHLAYVGTDKTSKGRGVATELIQRAIDLSEGKLSLHVDLDNKGAKKLYEKLGFKHCYNRMIYKEDQ